MFFNYITFINCNTIIVYQSYDQKLSDDLKSPMLMAVEKESVGMVAMLIKHGADPSAHHALNKFTSGWQERRGGTVLSEGVIKWMKLS